MIVVMTNSPDYFGPGVAESYDDPDDPMFSDKVLDPTVDLLADLAGDGGALELAIGTGRVAIPLAQRGVHVEGIDLSAAMIEQMRHKPGGQEIPAVVDDMTTARLGRTFALVYLVFNTISNVTSPDGQIAVFQTASAHLRAGSFVVEVGIPDLQ